VINYSLILIKNQALHTGVETVFHLSVNSSGSEIQKAELLQKWRMSAVIMQFKVIQGR